MKPARWYCPPGIPKPAHAVIPGNLQCELTGGPPGALPGGMCYGAAVEPDEAGWLEHPKGHWFNFTDAEPALLIRLDPHPCLITWKDTVGAHPKHLWRVPVLLVPEYKEDGDIARFNSALDRVWTGKGWNTDATIGDLQRRLLMVVHGIGTKRADLKSEESVQVALEILRLGQVFDEHEVTAAGWVNELLVVRVLIAACGMELAP